jgi:Putative transposase of IS4/5 family (DUF4096)
MHQRGASSIPESYAQLNWMLAAVTKTQEAASKTEQIVLDISKQRIHFHSLRGCLKSPFEIGYVRLHVVEDARERACDTDLSEDAWALIEPMVPLPRFGGRLRTTNVRAVLNAIFYLIQTGWRLLPRDFPVWGVV